MDCTNTLFFINLPSKLQKFLISTSDTTNKYEIQIVWVISAKFVKPISNKHDQEPTTVNFHYGTEQAKRIVLNYKAGCRLNFMQILKINIKMV